MYTTSWQSLSDSEKQKIITSGKDEDKRRHHATVCKMSAESLKPLDLEMLRLYDCNQPSSLGVGAILGICFAIAVVLAVLAGAFVYWMKKKEHSTGGHR